MDVRNPAAQKLDLSEILLLWSQDFGPLLGSENLYARSEVKVSEIQMLNWTILYKKYLTKMVQTSGQGCLTSIDVRILYTVQ